jgi:hypothetical protein
MKGPFRDLIVLTATLASSSLILAVLVLCSGHLHPVNAQGPCLAPAICSVTTNITWESAGKPDTRPGTYGTTDSVSSSIPFTNVPKGYLVQILHLSGDEIAAPHGTPKAGSMSYILAGATNTSPNQSPYVGPGLGSSGTLMYKQSPVSGAGARIPINESVLGTLNPDNILILKQSIFLDTTGVPQHNELTLVIQFQYVKGS